MYISVMPRLWPLLTPHPSEKETLESKIAELERSGAQSAVLKHKNEALTALQGQITELKAKCKENEKLLKLNKGTMMA